MVFCVINGTAVVGSSYNKSVDWMNASGDPKLLWQTMINNPGEWVDNWLTLTA